MKNKSVNIQRLRGSCEGPGESCLRPMVKAIKKKPSPFPFALRQDTIVTQMSRGTEVALIMVELGYSRRFSSMVVPFLEVMSRYLFPYVERWGRLLSAPPPAPTTASLCAFFCIKAEVGDFSGRGESWILPVTFASFFCTRWHWLCAGLHGRCHRSSKSAALSLLLPSSSVGCP